MDIPNETLFQICENMITKDLANFVQTHKRAYQVCSEILTDRKLQFELNIYLVWEIKQAKEILANHNLKTIPSKVISTIIDIWSRFGIIYDSYTFIFISIINDKRSNISSDNFVEALKTNRYSIVKAFLETGKIDPNDSKILHGIKPYDYGYQISHEIIELIVDDLRTTLSSRQKYERFFLFSYDIYGKIIREQFKEFDYYKYKFVDVNDLRKVVDDLTISDFDTLDKLHWKSIYMKNFDSPNLDDIINFYHMLPKTEFKQFVSRLNFETLTSNQIKYQIPEIIGDMREQNKYKYADILESIMLNQK